MPNWTSFPHSEPAYDYANDRLKEAWDDLHAGDCEPFPSDLELQEAWRCFHRGDFQQAVERADAIGIEAHAVANKATGIHATYLESDARRQQALFLQAIERAERAIEALPDDPNSHYFHAFNLGRYSQGISIARALTQGHGGKIKSSLEHTLRIAPSHAEAHTALGMFHAEVISQVGAMVAGVTYGAKKDTALKHFEEALRLHPESAIARMEYGNGLLAIVKKIKELAVAARGND